jgi:DnaK suppressor protein
MTGEEKAALKQMIEAEIIEIGEEIERIRTAIYPQGGEGISDKVAHISFKQEQSIHFQRYEEATKRLNRLKHAMLKVDTPEYGICKECEEEIALERLRLVPESVYCVACMNALGL